MRENNDYTLKELSSRLGTGNRGTGNLSNYENGKKKPTDKTLFRILTKGYGMGKKEAEVQIALWRMQEVEESYHLELAQANKTYNKHKKAPKTLIEFLKAEGLKKESISQIKKIIASYKRKEV